MKMAILLFLITTSVLSQTGPYKKRLSKANLAQKIVHVIDNSTVGAVQSVVGAGHILVFAAMKPFTNEPLLIKQHKGTDNSEVTQINIASELPWFNGAYSLGLFQVGGYAEDHEGGHSVASASLGPLYLPTVAVSYLLEGHDGSFMETWADIEAEPLPFMNTNSAQIGLGQTMIGGEAMNVVVFKFNLEQRQLQKEGNLVSDKIFQWINTKIIVPLNHDHRDTPPIVEFDLLSKRLNLVVDNIDLYLGADQSLRTNILTEQKYFHVENNPETKQFHIRALDWTAQYGVEYNLKNKLKVTPRLGIGLSADRFGREKNDFIANSFENKAVYTAGMSFVASLDINVLDYANLRTEYRKDKYLDGSSGSTFSARLGNEFRNPLKNKGAAQYVDFSAGYQHKKLEGPAGNFNWGQWNVTVGLRF